MNFEKFTIKSQEALQKSAEIAMNSQQQAIEPGHLLKAILETDENVVSYLVKKLNVNKNLLDTKIEEVLHSFPKLSGQQPYLSPNTNAVLQQAEKELKEFARRFTAHDGLNPHCRKCVNNQSNERRLRNKSPFDKIFI